MKKSLFLIALVAAVCFISSCRPSRPACPAYTQIAKTFCNTVAHF